MFFFQILVVVERDARVESESPERRIARLAEIKRQLKGRDKKRHQRRLRQWLSRRLLLLTTSDIERGQRNGEAAQVRRAHQVRRVRQAQQPPGPPPGPR